MHEPTLANPMQGKGLTCLQIVPILLKQPKGQSMFQDALLSEVEVFSLSHHGPDLPLSDNFVLGEFACNDGTDEVKIHPALVLAVQMIREHFGAPVKINSGYRTPAYNKKIGGAKESQHVKGMAADIAVFGIDPDIVAEYAEEELGMGGVGRYNTFTHVDVWGSMRRWNG